MTSKEYTQKLREEAVFVALRFKEHLQNMKKVVERGDGPDFVKIQIELDLRNVEELIKLTGKFTEVCIG